MANQTASNPNASNESAPNHTPADVFSERYQLRIFQEIEIAAPVAAAFEATLEQLGPSADLPGGAPMPMKLEAWPGGRWYRDLGNNAGHFWGHVQVIKPPALLELCGPMFMSYPVLSHVQYRFIAKGAGTTLQLTHRMFGEVSPEHRAGVAKGWGHILNGIQRRAAK